MPIRGENIGTAYVRIVADGDGLDESIRESFDESEPSVREAGEEHGRTYGDAFDKEVRKSYKGQFGKTQTEMFEDANKRLTESLARLELSERFFSSRKWNEFRTRLVDEFGDAGSLAGQRLEEKFRDSTNLESLAGEMRRIGPEVRRAQADIVREMEQVEAESLARRNRNLSNFFRDQRDGYTRISGSLGVLGDNGRKLADALGEVTPGLDEARRGASRLTPNLDALDDRIRRVADGVGKAFGAGSRNNFLNFFGSAIGNVVGLARVLPRLASSLIDIGGTFRDAFTGAGGGMEGLVAGVGTLGPLAATAAAGGTALAIGLAALVAIIGPLIALVSGLVGVLAALAGTLGFAVVAGIVAVGGALVPLIAGIGSVVLAWQTMSDAMRENLLARIQPLTDGLKGLGRVARNELFTNLGPQLNQFGRAIDSLTPLVRGAARGMRGAFNGWADDLDSPGFRHWADQMGNVLPPMIRSLGNILSNALGGIGGFFTAAAPFIQNFLNWVEQLTQQFQDWANSAGGRREIADFLERAADSAKSLGDFLGEAGGLLMDVLNAGQGTGNNIFDSMADAMRRFRGYLADNPDALRDWFANAQDLAGALGDALVAVGHLVDKLDSPEARKTINALVSGFGHIVEFAAAAGGLVDSGLLFPLSKVLVVVGDVVSAIRHIPDLNIKIPHLPKVNVGDIFTGIGRATRFLVSNWNDLDVQILKAIGKVDVGGIIKGTAKAIGGMLGDFAGTAAQVVRRIGKADIGNIIIGIPRAIASLLNPFNGSGGRVVKTIGKADVGNMITGVATALGNLITPFSPAGGRILRTIGSVNVSGIISGASTAAQNLVNAFSGLASRIVSAIGTIVPHVSMPHIPLTAAGGTFGGVTDRAMLRWVGEDGPEAIVPLNRPLSQVDPAVRALSAIAQGLQNPPGMATGGTSPSRVVNANIQVVTPTTDVRAVARETINQLVAVGY